MSDAQGLAHSLSKPEMEEMSQNLRSELGLGKCDALNALALKIQGVDVVVPLEVVGLSEGCLRYLTEDGSADWSAMSVPLNLAEDRWVIFRNDCHSLERQRVTFLEECWHIRLGHKLTKMAKIPIIIIGGSLCNGGHQRTVQITADRCGLVRIPCLPIATMTGVTLRRGQLPYTETDLKTSTNERTYFAIEPVTARFQPNSGRIMSLACQPSSTNGRPAHPPVVR